MQTNTEKTMSAVVDRLGARLAEAGADRTGALLDLVARHQERGKHGAAVAVGLDAVEASAADPLERCDALCAIARSLLAAEAYEMAARVTARAIHDAVTAEDPVREARARELQGLLHAAAISRPRARNSASRGSSTASRATRSP